MLASKTLAVRAGWFLFFLAIVVVLQYLKLSYSCELAENADEPAHFVTGLMVRDYLASGFHTGPLSYAQNYYLHYPKVAIGHFPPLFYLIEAAWLCLFPASSASLLFLMGSITALVAVVVRESLLKEFGIYVSVIASLAILSVPLVYESSRRLMTEAPMALLVVCAVLAFGDFVDTGRRRSAVLFGLLAAAAMLVKGSGIELALVPPLTLLFTRRFDLLRHPFFWIPALLVALVAGPWYLWVPGAQHETVDRFGTPMIASWRFTETFHRYWFHLGPVFTGLALIGAADRIRGLRTGSVSAKWAAALSLIVSSYCFRIAIGVWETRHLITGIVLAGLFIAPGLARVMRSRTFTRIPARWRLALAGVVAGLAMYFNYQWIENKTHIGFDNVAQFLVSQPQWNRSAILVASDAIGEGLLVSEIASREARPGHYVMRSTKILGSSGWMGESVQRNVHTPEEVMRVLDRFPVGILVVDRDAPTALWSRLLLDSVRRFPDLWEPVPFGPVANDVPSARHPQVFRRIGHESRTVSQAEIRTALGGVIAK